MNNLNMFLLDDVTKINTNSNKINISELKIKDKVLSASPNGIEEKTIKTTIVSERLNDVKRIELASKDCIYPSLNNKLFVSTEDDYDLYKVVVLCAGKFQKIAYRKCPTYLFTSFYPEADRIYILYVTPNEELAKYTAEYFINNANIKEEQYEEARKILNKDDYSDHSFLQQYGIDENYANFDKAHLPMYIRLTTNYDSKNKYSLLLIVDDKNIEKEINELYNNILNVVPYKEINYYNWTCEIEISSSDYEFIYNIAKAVEDFAIKNIHPKISIEERLYVQSKDFTKTYTKLPVSNICKGMTLPVVIENEIIPTTIASVNDYKINGDDIFETAFQKGKGLEIEDTHIYLTNDIVVPDKKN